MKDKIKVYIIARISPEAHRWTDEVCTYLDASFEVFKPKDHNPWNQRHELLSKHVFDCDLAAIKASHIGLMLPEYGNDCAWEAGWYSASDKPSVIFTDTQTEWLRDWMVKGGAPHIITCNTDTYAILKNDPILMHKNVMLIKKMEDLGGALKYIYAEHYAFSLPIEESVLKNC